MTSMNRVLQESEMTAGKKADFVALSQNLYEIDQHDIYRANVLLTIVDGVVRHRDGM